MSSARTDTVLITGAAGFIGFHLARYYQRAGYQVIGTDYPIADFLPDDIRRRRLATLQQEGILLECGNLAQRDFARALLHLYRPRIIFHLAARVNVRDLNKKAFDKSNISALCYLLHAAREVSPAHFLFASTSSVYGENAPRPFCESYLPELSEVPATPYAKTKFIGEKMAAAASCDFPVTTVRFFNVYGPWGRTDMAPFIFADALRNRSEITIFSEKASRAWLYIDDAITACVALAKKVPEDNSRYRVVNVAGPALIKTIDVLDMMAAKTGQVPHVQYKPPRIKEVSSNPANTDLLFSLVSFRPQTVFADGIENFLVWHWHYWENRYPQVKLPFKMQVKKKLTV